MLFLGGGLSLVAEMQKNSFAGALPATSQEEKELLLILKISQHKIFTDRQVMSLILTIFRSLYI